MMPRRVRARTRSRQVDGAVPSRRASSRLDCRASVWRSRMMPESSSSMCDIFAVFRPFVRSEAPPDAHVAIVAPRSAVVRKEPQDMPVLDHEEVVIRKGPRSGLPVIIAIHSTVLGQAVGGCRVWHYGSWQDALADALRLSAGMTSKCAASG